MKNSVSIFLVVMFTTVTTFAQTTGNEFETGRVNNFVATNLGAKGQSYRKKNVAIIVGTSPDSEKVAAAGYKLFNLLGHFNAATTVINNNNYQHNDIRDADVVFYVGLEANESPSPLFLNDIYASRKTIVWIHSGLQAFETFKQEQSKLGFTVGTLNHSGLYTVVTSNNKVFNKSASDLYMVQLDAKSNAMVLATATSNTLRKTVPYIIRSKNLYYIADIPYFNLTGTDRYLLFADMLHDILQEQHPEEHKAMVRIEDVTPMRDPDRLRKIADILSERKIPFLIGVVPIFINPTQNVRISLSDKPDVVAALKYCVSKGATIVMHGVTHQYKGESAIDFEFWDGTTNKPIADETEAGIAAKIEEGLHECAKNGLYPLVWETPHYTASTETYKVVSRYFSSTIERFIVTNSFKYGQFFPYEIQNDMYGQKVYPEDLGYMPLNYSKDTSEIYVANIINNAKSLLNVRDGYATFFFHTFVNLDYLKEIADGISKLGFTFADVKKENNNVTSNDLIILSGSQKYTVKSDNLNITEMYFDAEGHLQHSTVSSLTEKGLISKKIILKPGELYVAQTSSIMKDKLIAHKNKGNKPTSTNTLDLHQK